MGFSYGSGTVQNDVKVFQMVLIGKYDNYCNSMEITYPYLYSEQLYVTA
jgi:hypothetical protein